MQHRENDSDLCVSSTLTALSTHSAIARQQSAFPLTNTARHLECLLSSTLTQSVPFIWRQEMFPFDDDNIGMKKIAF